MVFSNNKRKLITLWTHLRVPLQLGPLERSARKYSKVNNNADIKIQSFANHGECGKMTKKSIEEGLSPDLYMGVCGYEIADWVERNLLTPLNDYIEKIELDLGVFLPGTWEMCFYKGNLYGLPPIAPPVEVLFWNKDMFQKVELNPEQPPTTIEELDNYAEKLTKYDNM